MMVFRLTVSALALAAFTGCASIEFYAPEVASGPKPAAITARTDSASVLGVTVTRTAVEYSPVISVGNLLLPAYQGSRRANWSLEGPEGFKAQLEVIQTGLIFSGPAVLNSLQPDTVDYSKASTTLRLTGPDGVVTAEYSGVKTIPDVALGTLTLTPHYQGSADGKVTDYQSFGMVTGLRILTGESLLGYISLVGQPALYLGSSDTAPQPLPLGTALALSRPQFAGGLPALQITPEEVDFFGIKLKSSVTHN